MPRVKRGILHRKRVNKIMKMAKGYRQARKRRLKHAKDQIAHSLTYAYRDRRNKKRDIRKLWIIRINAAASLGEAQYSRFMEGLKKAGIEINRKMLSELALSDDKALGSLIESAKKQLV